MSSLKKTLYDDLFHLHRIDAFFWDLYHGMKCELGLHKLWVVRELSEDTQLIGCRICNRFWGMNHRVRAFLPFDEEMYQMYKSFGVPEMKGTNFELHEFVTKDRPLSMFRG